MKSLAFLLILLQDPADQLRRQELALRLEELAGSGRLEALAKAVQRELRGKRVDGPTFDVCWRIAAVRRWDGKLEDFLAAWDRAAAVEPPAPGQTLFRARLESLVSKPKYRDQIEAAVKRWPGEPAILWHVAKARLEAADYAGTASALEEMASVKGVAFDTEDFHRMLAQSYGETGRPAAAVEHLRALREDRTDFAELAALAVKCRVPGEAARFYALALEEEPERLSLRSAYIRALQASGLEAAAAVERRRMFLADGKVVPSKVEDYFFLLPVEGRSEEIARILRELLSDPQEPFEKLLFAVPTEDRAAVAAAWEKSAADARSWVVLAHMKKSWSKKLDQMIDALEKGEKLFPADPAFPREKIEPLLKLNRFPEVAAAYVRLVELDPDGKKTGPRPWTAVQAAMRGLVESRDSAAALRLGVLAMSEPAGDAESRSAVRTTMKPACELAGNEFWAELRKLKLPPADPKAAEAIKGHVAKLGDDEFAVRSEAARELQKQGLPAIPALLERIDDPDAEIRSRTREIIRAILSE